MLLTLFVISCSNFLLSSLAYRLKVDKIKGKILFSFSIVTQENDMVFRFALVALLFSLVTMGCKTTSSSKTRLSAGGGAGGLCPTLDPLREKRPAERARLITFLVEMMTKGNHRATSLLLSSFSRYPDYGTFMKAWHQQISSSGNGALLAKLSGVSEADINTEVEARETERATAALRSGNNSAPIPSSSGRKIFADMRIMQEFIGSTFKEAVTSGELQSKEARDYFKRMMASAYNPENALENSGAAAQQNKANFRTAMLQTLSDAAISSSIVTRGNAEVDVLVAEAIGQSFKELIDMQLNKPSSKGVSELNRRFAEVEALYNAKESSNGREALVNLKDAITRLEAGLRDPRNERFKKLQQDRQTLESLTNLELATRRMIEKNNGKVPEFVKKMAERQSGRRR
jgi:hypothetical protein